MKPADEIDPAILAELDALPTSSQAKEHDLTQVQVLELKYMRKRGVAWADLVAWWKKRYGWGCENTLRAKWREIQK